MARYDRPVTPTESRIESKASFREKAGEELREFIILTAYLYVCFAAVLYFKAAVLRALGIAYAPLGLAIIKAAICAKFMLMGRVFHLGDRFKSFHLSFQRCTGRSLTRNARCNRALSRPSRKAREPGYCCLRRAAARSQLHF